MQVGLDLLFLVPGQTGGRETYARELLRGARARSGPTCELTALRQPRDGGGRRGLLERGGARGRGRRPPARARRRWALGELWRLPRAARGLDVLHSPANFGPLTAGRSPAC